MIFRTAEQKDNLRASFLRPDRPFFAAGACHILAQAFLDSVDSNDWKASLILPHQGFRGTHVFAGNDRYVFDYHGFTLIDRYHNHYFKKMSQRFSGWKADILQLDVSPISTEFCTRYHHQLPGQFYKDPMPRAIAFVRKFNVPDDA